MAGGMIGETPIRTVPGGTTMSDAAIAAEDLAYSYGDRLAVDGVSFTVARGEVFGFLGPNGAGKSTTIKMLTGQVAPQRGTVTVLGMRVPHETEAIQGRIGVSFEEKNLYLNMTANENLRFFARLYGISDLAPEPLLDRVGLGGKGDDRVGSYSKGMQQRLMIARTLLNTPDVLFLDEPTAGLDPVSARAIRAIVQQEAARGAAVFLTTHDMMEADQLSDRVGFINDGKLLIIDTPENLKVAHGRRQVRVRKRTGDEIGDVVIPLDTAEAGEQLRSVVGEPGVMTIHTEEATLEDIFVEFAGRGLEA
jgi:ABC-2 type transport system ATP-binding protein